MGFTFLSTEKTKSTSAGASSGRGGVRQVG